MIEFPYDHWVQAAQTVAVEFAEAAAEQKRPCVLFRPRVFPDGDQWCALYGDNVQEGVAAFGSTPAEACRNFDLEWAGAHPHPNPLQTPGTVQHAAAERLAGT